MKYLELKVPPPIVILLTALLIGCSVYAGLLPQPIPLPARIAIFVIILFLCGLILVSTVKLFGKAKTTWLPQEPAKATALVTEGIYRYSRNPMYFAWAVILFGWGILLGDGLGLFFVPLFMLYLTRFQIIPEERALEKLFGDEYREYKKQVRRWI